MPFFDVRAEMPKTRFQASTFVKLIQDAISEEVAGEVTKMTEQTIATWVNKPEIKVEITARGSRVSVGSVSVGRRRKPIWKYLDEGTAHRYATMTKGFKAKTRPGYLVSYTGAGRKAYVNTDIDRGPIAPRNWSKTIQERGQKAIRLGVRNAIRKGLLKV